MKKKHILVTGAGGYIGRPIVKRLLDNNYEVTAVDLKTDEIDKRANKINVNIFSGESNIYTDLGSPDVCLHLAWSDGFKHNSLTHMQLLSKHFEFLANMIKSGLKHLAVMGTMHEIGYYEGEIKDDTPTNPQSLYGIAKNSLRQSLFTVQKEYNFIFQWLRAFYIYGDDLKNHSIFTKLIEAEQQGEEYFPFNSGQNQYDFITLDELSKQISMSIMQTEVSGIINCCSGKPVPLKEVVENFISSNGYRIKLKYGAFPDRPYDSPAIWGNNDKIRKITEE